MKLMMVDAIGPFFLDYKRHRINWSKIPFDNLEWAGGLDRHKFARIEQEFGLFTARTSRLGFNAVTLDDVAHLAESPDYSFKTNDKIRQYQDAFERLFRTAATHGMQVFLTTDIMFEHLDNAGSLRSLERQAIPFMQDALTRVLDRFPAVAGIILRIGECDAKDVVGDFRSRLVIKSPGQANKLIKKLLPMFEERKKLMIFRTWTVGAYRIGDLIWNRDTYDRAFSDIGSRYFAVSMKYGETDFFRYLPLNRHFFRSRHQKIVEFQARREYEGFGEFPSFIGHDYENYVRQLGEAPNLIGAWIWCQTGGWTSFRRRTFIDQSGIWNEINARVTLSIVKNGLTCEEAVHEACRDMLPGRDSDKMLALLRLSDEVIKELLYIDDFARRKIFFRRCRVPPLLSVYWDRILINHSMRKLLRCFVEDREEKILQGRSALSKIVLMKHLAKQLDLPAEDFNFMHDTCEIIQASREYYFGDFDQEMAARLETMVEQYRRRRDRVYRVQLDFSRLGIPRARIRRLLSVLLRYQHGYRLVDRILVIRLLSVISPILSFWHRRRTRDIAASEAMGIETILK